MKEASAQERIAERTNPGGVGELASGIRMVNGNFQGGFDERDVSVRVGVEVSESRSLSLVPLALALLVVCGAATRTT